LAVAAAAAGADLLDYHLPDGSGPQLSGQLRREGNKAAVVMLTADGSERALIASVEAGAAGFFVKTAPVSHIRSAVRRAAEGEMLVPGAQLAALLRKQREQASQEASRADLLHRLTPRERTILDLSREGLDNPGIARKLGISVTTVRGHVQNTLEKLGVHSKLEAVVRVSSP
jgi:DNA-binding NarL/FixJ family response regulator